VASVPVPGSLAINNEEINGGRTVAYSTSYEHTIKSAAPRAGCWLAGNKKQQTSNNSKSRLFIERQCIVLIQFDLGIEQKEDKDTARGSPYRLDADRHFYSFIALSHCHRHNEQCRTSIHRILEMRGNSIG
jgi:hypothetical protein